MAQKIAELKIGQTLQCPPQCEGIEKAIIKDITVERQLCVSAMQYEFVTTIDMEVHYIIPNVHVENETWPLSVLIMEIEAGVWSE